MLIESAHHSLISEVQTFFQYIDENIKNTYFECDVTEYQEVIQGSMSTKIKVEVLGIRNPDLLLELSEYDAYNSKYLGKCYF